MVKLWIKEIRVGAEYPAENREEAGHLRDLQCGTPLKHIHPVINPPLAYSPSDPPPE